MELRLLGEAQDYVGKGMHGGEIVLMPPSGATFDSSDSVIMGNTTLYGATGGRLFAAGKAGEASASAIPACSPSSKAAATTVANT